MFFKFYYLSFLSIMLPMALTCANQDTEVIQAGAGKKQAGSAGDASTCTGQYCDSNATGDSQAPDNSEDTLSQMPGSDTSERSLDFEKDISQGCTAGDEISQKLQSYNLNYEHVQCEGVAGSVSTTSVYQVEVDDHPTHGHADLNIFLRGFRCNSEPSSKKTQDGPVDSGAPRIYTSVGDSNSQISNTYDVYDWNWPASEHGEKGRLIKDVIGGNKSTTGIGLKTSNQQKIKVPRRDGQDIGGGHVATVLYATANQITLNYTRDDTVANGYTIHITGVCIDPKIVESFNSTMDSSSRPALAAGQTFGVSLGDEIQLMVRDRGSFMNPRDTNHWWQN